MRVRAFAVVPIFVPTLGVRCAVSRFRLLPAGILMTLRSRRVRVCLVSRVHGPGSVLSMPILNIHLEAPLTSPILPPKLFPPEFIFGINFKKFAKAASPAALILPSARNFFKSRNQQSREGSSGSSQGTPHVICLPTSV